MTCEPIDGFAPLLDRYRGFLLDQWGVLHNGVRTYPGVLDVLQALRAAGRPVVLLSNSGKRAVSNAERLAAMGIDAALYRAVITSGEIAWCGLRDRAEPLFADLGRRCYFVARHGDRAAIAGLGLQLTGADSADFVLLAGTDSSADATRAVEAQLATALARRLPVICSNPDFSSVEPGSDAGKTPGTLAQQYQRAGGEVRWVGKPWPAVYRAALAALDLPPADVLMVGDSLHHDIQGAHDAGIEAALLSGGVHRDAFGRAATAAQRLAALETLCAAAGVAMPRWLAAAFAL